MKKKPIAAVSSVVLLLSLNLFSLRCFSQSITTRNGKYEVGVGFGPMFFLGDLGGGAGVGKNFLKDLDFSLAKLAKMVYANYYPSEWLGFRVALAQSIVVGDDAKTNNKGGDEAYRIARNLSFKSTIWEAYIAAEIYPTVFLERYSGLSGKFRPYGLIGVGVFKFNPKAKLDDQWVELHPLRLEGQGLIAGKKEYKLTQAEIPMAIGFKFFVTRSMYVGMEIMYRKLFTDYVDDVSTTYPDPVIFNALPAGDAEKARRLYYRGNPATPPAVNEQRGDPTDNDSFFSTILRFGWRLHGNDPISNGKRQMRCPKL